MAFAEALAIAVTLTAAAIAEGPRPMPVAGLEVIRQEQVEPGVRYFNSTAPLIFCFFRARAKFSTILEPFGSAQNKGPGTFPSSRLDLHRHFEQFWLGHVEFRCFPTHFVPISMFFINAEVGDHFWCP